MLKTHVFEISMTPDTPSALVLMDGKLLDGVAMVKTESDYSGISRVTIVFVSNHVIITGGAELIEEVAK